MALEGRIAERTRALLPVTWDALAGDSRFGDPLLQTAIDTAKESVTGVVVTPTAESAYPLVVVDYVAKVGALELIPAGIDFWMNEPSSESSTGTDENHTFVDRADKLRQLAESFLVETREKADEIAVILGFSRTSGKSVPRSSTIDDEFLTPSHQEFPRPYVQTGRS